MPDEKIIDDETKADIPIEQNVENVEEIENAEPYTDDENDSGEEVDVETIGDVNILELAYIVCELCKRTQNPDLQEQTTEYINKYIADNDEKCSIM